MTKAIATDDAASGITANCLAPGCMTRLQPIARPIFEKLHASGQPPWTLDELDVLLRKSLLEQP